MISLASIIFCLLCVASPSQGLELTGQLPACEPLAFHLADNELLLLTDVDERRYRLSSHGELLLQEHAETGMRGGVDGVIHPEHVLRLLPPILHSRIQQTNDWVQGPCTAIFERYIAIPGQEIRDLELNLPWIQLAPGDSIRAFTIDDGLVWSFLQSAGEDPVLRLQRIEAGYPYEESDWPFELPEAISCQGERLFVCRGQAGLQFCERGPNNEAVIGANWSPEGPVNDMVHWRDTRWVLASGTAGLLVSDLPVDGDPLLLGQWRTVSNARRLMLSGDTLLVDEGSGGFSLHILSEEAGQIRLDRLALNRTQPQVLAFDEPASTSASDQQSVWMLDQHSGWRKWMLGAPDQPAEFAEELSIAVPVPVEGGDVRDGLVCGGRRDAGLLYYQIVNHEALLRGVHPTDPVKLLAWGPDDLIAYVTPEGFVAIKQANRSPWFLLHHGWINLSCVPEQAVWCGRQLYVSANDGRLFHVNVEDPLAPELVETLSLPSAVADLAVCEADFAGAESGILLVAADRLSVFQQADQPDSLSQPFVYPERAGQLTSCSIEILGDSGGLAIAGFRNPDELVELRLPDEEYSGHWMDALPLEESPLAVMHVGHTGILVAGEGGTLYRLHGSDQVALEEPGGRLPAALDASLFPNPFNPEARLVWTQQHAGDVRITVYDTLGRILEEMQEASLPVGRHDRVINMKDHASGLIFILIETAESRECVKGLFVR
jgi:hypothetical protein